jgi:hypothetical protein
MLIGNIGPTVRSSRLDKYWILKKFLILTIYTVALPRAVSESVRSLVMWCLRFATSHVKVDMAPISCCSGAASEDSLNSQRSSRKRAVKIHETLLGEAISVEQEGQCSL